MCCLMLPSNSARFATANAESFRHMEHPNQRQQKVSLRADGAPCTRPKRSWKRRIERVSQSMVYMNKVWSCFTKWVLMQPHKHSYHLSRNQIIKQLHCNSTEPKSTKYTYVILQSNLQPNTILILSVAITTDRWFDNLVHGL